nr:SUN domain-containing protein 5-like [Tanacetum cinerariifolium]
MVVSFWFTFWLFISAFGFIQGNKANVDAHSSNFTNTTTYPHIGEQAQTHTDRALLELNKFRNNNCCDNTCNKKQFPTSFVPESFAELLLWKASMEKEIADLESWKAFVSSHLELIVRENAMLRQTIEKVASDQENLDKAELTVLAEIQLWDEQCPCLNSGRDKGFCVFYSFGPYGYWGLALKVLIGFGSLKMNRISPSEY